MNNQVAASKPIAHSEAAHQFPETKIMPVLVLVGVCFLLWVSSTFFANEISNAIINLAVDEGQTIRESAAANNLVLLGIQGITVLIAVVLPLMGICFLQLSVRESFGLNIRLASLPFWLIALTGLLIFNGTLTPEVTAKIFSKENNFLVLWISGIPLVLVSVVFIQPIIEEFLFRGFMQNSLARATSPAIAIAITSLAWTASHFQIWQYENPMVPFGIYLIFGLLLGCSMHFSRCLLIPISVHIVNNLVAVSSGL